MREFVKVMKALSDPNRVKMLKLLQRRTLCVCQMQKALGLAQSTTSKHLKILEDAQLVTFVKDGQWVWYRPAENSGNPYAASLLGNLQHWLQEDVDVAALQRRLAEADGTSGPG